MGKNVAPKFLFLIPIFIACCVCNEMSDEPTKAPIGCHKRLLKYRVTQSDTKGNTCTDTISVNACWGRCDSKEISDWKFPFKKSFHPVCVHSGRTKVSAVLKNCEPDAGPEARKYDYMEALACSCQICSTIDTSCESPQILQKGKSVVKLIGTEFEDDYSLLPEKN